MPQEPGVEGRSPPRMCCPTCGERFAPGLLFCPHHGSRLRPAEAESGASDEPAGAPSLVGKVLAERYRMVRKIGEGGMGEVYEAEHVYLARRVAIKTLRPEIVGNPEALGRFQQEARAASMIGHENIVTIEDFGPVPGGGVYMAMEFLDGVSLGERMRDQALPRSQAVDIMVQVCRGLAAAHEKGIVHRDMKPENVFLVPRDGHTLVKILDFGIAKVSRAGSSGPQLTQTGAVFGTPFYMSPEQALGRPLDARADVYAVGIILYQVFAGRVPFEGDSFMAILSQHITAAPALPSRLSPERNIPPAFEKVIMKAIAKEPAHRFQSMSALAEALVAAEAHPASHVIEAPSATAAPIELAEQPPNRLLERALPREEPRAPSTGRSLLRLGMVAIGLAVIGGGSVVALRALSQDGGGLPAAVRSAVGETAARLTSGDTTAHPQTVEIVLDSQPGGAKVLAGGKVIAETPEVLKVRVDQPLEVLLHKDGYTPRQLTLDPARDGHKVLVKLERDPSHHAHPSPGATAVEPATGRPPPTRAAVHPAAGAPLDPYPEAR